MNPREAYTELLRRARDNAVLASCSALLGWDEQTFMPHGGGTHRAEQLAVLAGLHHEKATDPRIGALLEALEDGATANLDDPDAGANLRELRRTYGRLTRLPRGLVEELARTTSVAQQEWVEARQGSDFARLRPWLERIVSLKRQEADCLGYAESRYDALLDEYEPGARTREIAPLFDALRAELVPLVGAIGRSRRRPDADLLRREFPVERQQVFGETVAAAVGFDFRRGRLDATAHPFCSGIGPGDCRITTRYNAHDFSDSFFSVLHEVGHGLYDQGLPAERYGTPMGESVSLGVHESQSRLWENAVGRGRPFWEYWFPLARQVFHTALADVTLDAFHAAINRVEPSLNRVRADEVTYNLHIFIRFELEVALLAGDLDVADLPGAWNERYRKDLGITPPNDAEGCLQDIHWSAGLIGYFPTYTLGNVFAAQLFERAGAELGNLDEAFSRGHFEGLLGWLRDRIHRQGHRYRAGELIERATGSRPDPRPLIETLRNKYGTLYDL